MENTQDLLLAAQVRALAIELRKEAFANEEAAWKESNPKKEISPASERFEDVQSSRRESRLASADRSKSRDDFSKDWKDNNPLEAFIPLALIELKRIAALIKQ